MPHYTIHDIFPTLTRVERATARPLALKELTDPELNHIWENGVTHGTTENFSVRLPIFSFFGTAGASYGVASASYHEPDRLIVYDNLGNAIAYDDGSSAVGVDYAGFIAPYTGFYYVNASWSQGTTVAQRDAALAIYEDRKNVPMENVIHGSADDETIDDTVHADVVDGMDGVDTFSVKWSHDQYHIEITDGIVAMSHNDYPYIVDTLKNVERIWFADGYTSFETDGFISEAYRLYQAAFDRKPDAAGLGYWIGQMDDGMSLYTVAEAFMQSNEFSTLYGKAPNNADILTHLYWNILDRAPDQGGFDYWIGMLNTKAIDTVDVLVAFSESAENTARTFDDMNAGYFFNY